MLSVLLALLLAVSVFAACGKENEAEQTEASADNTEVSADNTEVSADASEEATEEEPTEPAIPDSLELVKEYIESEDGSEWVYCLLIVKNISDETLKVTCTGEAKDAAGNVLCDDDDKINAIGPDQVAFLYMTFTETAPDAKYSYQVTAEPAENYDDVLANLSYTSDVTKENEGEYNRSTTVTVSVTNNGDVVAKNVEALAICFDADGNYFCHEHIIGIYDDDYELKPGATESGSLSKFGAFSDYETAEVYIRGNSKMK